MNILIVHAHENINSFSSALANIAAKHFTNSGHEVNISDLYQKNFNPVASKHDFNQTTDSKHYKYAIEQLNAVKSNGFTNSVKDEMNALEHADVLIFNFPLWWFGMPAILKGWVDRILAYGFAYGDTHGFYANGRFKGKKAFLCVTTGSPETFYTKEGAHGRSLENILQNINEGILELVGFDVLQPFIAYAVSHISEEDRIDILKKYITYLSSNFNKGCN